MRVGETVAFPMFAMDGQFEKAMEEFRTAGEHFRALDMTRDTERCATEFAHAQQREAEWRKFTFRRPLERMQRRRSPSWIR